MIDYAYTPRTFFIIAEENIIGYCIIITMPENYTTLAFFKNISPHLVAARFYGYYLGFSIAVLKQVICDLCKGIELAMLGYANPDDLSSIGGQRHAETKIIMVDGMMVFTTAVVV
jgi:hypothetical protein